MTAAVWFVVFLVVVVVVGLVLLVAAGAIGVGLGAKDITDRANALKGADDILDQAFNGRPHVVFRIAPGSLPFETVVIGAEGRGYVLVAQSEDPMTRVTTLIFAKEKA